MLTSKDFDLRTKPFHLTNLQADNHIEVTYPVMEHFYTLQGEGFYQGKAAYFVRLGGCDVGCVWCDVKDSWDATKHPVMKVSEILQAIHDQTSEAKQHHREIIVVITGGEPLMHALDPLTTALRQAEYRTHLETSGAHPLSGQWDWICLSPKKFKAPLTAVIPFAHELKMIVYNKTDFEWAEQFAAQVNEHCQLFLQPEWDKQAQVTPLIVDYVQQHPQWTLSLQIHKYINVP